MNKKSIHQWAWIILLTFVIIGIIYPFIGVIALICMLAPVILAFFKGRMWCGNFCPRGSFNDIVLAKISRKKAIPKVFKTTWFRISFLIILMSFFCTQLVVAWGDLKAVGAVFIRIIIITTLLGIILGIIYNQRTWCAFCPMGTLSHFVTKFQTKKQRIPSVGFETTKCTNCKLCTKNCPIGIDLLEYKDHGEVNHTDCLKCNVCVEKCPKKALKFE